MLDRTFETHHLLFLFRFSLQVRYSVIDSAQMNSVLRAGLMMYGWEFVTRDTEECLLSIILTGACFKRKFLEQRFELFVARDK